jgi:hypothetical protein
MKKENIITAEFKDNFVLKWKFYYKGKNEITEDEKKEIQKTVFYLKDKAVKF